MDKPKNCICGKRPKLKKRPVWGGGKAVYFFYECKDCGISTFAARLKEFAVSLWDATINRKLKIW